MGGLPKGYDNLNVHRATDVLLFCLQHPRWKVIFQPKYAVYINLIELWWKTLRSLALKGRRFESWEEIVKEIEEAPPVVPREPKKFLSVKISGLHAIECARRPWGRRSSSPAGVKSDGFIRQVVAFT